MPKEKYMGWGASGVKGRPGLKKDLEAMTDKAKRQRRKKLEKVTADNLKRVQQGKKARSISQYEREKTARRTQSVAQRIRTYQAKVADLRAKARAVEQSKTGNVKARDTYLKTANEYLKKIKQLRAREKK